MSKVEDFLTSVEEQEIVQAIAKAEQNTSGEIRVHIESTQNPDSFARAKEVFHILKMDNTKLQNSVLIYVAINTKQFVIYGDEGINKVVPKNFWDTTRDEIQVHFKNGNYKTGLISGILKAGQELSSHFPWDSLDENELSNEISKG